MSRPSLVPLRAAVPAARRLPPDERSVATAALLRAGSVLTAEELALCTRVVAPGAPPLGSRDRLKLSELAGRLLGRAAP